MRRGVLLVIAMVLMMALMAGCDQNQRAYEEAVALMDSGEYIAAQRAFDALGDYNDAPERSGQARKKVLESIQQGTYDQAVAFMTAGDYSAALDKFSRIDDFKDAADLSQECMGHLAYEEGLALYEAGDYEGAIQKLEGLTVGDSAQLLDECKQRIGYAAAMQLYEAGDYEGAAQKFEGLTIGDSAQMLAKCSQQAEYDVAHRLYEEGDYQVAAEALAALADFADAQQLRQVCEARVAYDAAVVSGDLSALRSAQALLSALPDDAEDRDLYLDILKAFTDMEAGEYLSAARGFASLKERTEEIASKDYVRKYEAWVRRFKAMYRPIGVRLGAWEEQGALHSDRFSYSITAIEDLQTVLARIQAGATGADDLKSMAKSVAGAFHELSYECVYRHQDAREDEGLPAEVLPDFPHDERREFWWTSMRVEALEQMATRQHSGWRFEQTDGSSMPETASVRGICLLFSNERNSELANGKLKSSLFKATPPFSVAGSPERVRYVLKVAETHTLYGTYDDGSKAYQTTTRVTIKDLATGELLHNRTYIGIPPRKTGKSGDIYGEHEYTDKETAEIVAVLERLVSGTER